MVVIDIKQMLMKKNSLMVLFLDDNSTEEYIYNRFKEIIFDPTMSFSHSENEY